MIAARMTNMDKALLAFIKLVVAKTQKVYELLAVNQKLYLHAVVVLLAYLIFPKVLNPDLERTLLYVFGVFWLIAIGNDLVTIYKKIYGTLVGKGFLLLLLTIFTNVALGLSGQVINDITNVNPSNFPHAQTILAVLMIPILVIVMGAFLYFVILVSSPIVLMFHISDEGMKKFLIPGYLMTNKISYLRITRVTQVVSIIIFFGLIYSASQKIIDQYSDFVSDSARFLVYNIEMYSKAPCPVNAGTRIAFMGDDKILVGIKNKSETIFKLAECKIELK